MQCPRCQHENPTGMTFCGECGRPSKGTDKSGPPVPSYAALQHVLSEALGQIQTRDRELVEAQEQPTALGAVSGTPALNDGAGTSGTSSAFAREREFGLSDRTAGDGASGVTYTAFPTAPWYRALAFATVAGYTPGVLGGAPYRLPVGW
jgi:hypothetical protein